MSYGNILVIVLVVVLVLGTFLRAVGREVCSFEKAEPK
jgi:Sec-independent protein translocase protein TatA